MSIQRKQKIMILGAGGQVGRSLAEAAMPENWTLGLFTRADADVVDVVALRDLFLSFKPDLVINAAAYVAVDGAEQERDLATAVNFHAAAHMAAQCSQHDVPMIQLSTDYVFDGRKDVPYAETDLMNPINVYGATKLMGEEAVRHELAWHVVLRLASVFSAFGRNIMTNTIKLIDERDTLRMVTDQLSCPTSASDVAQCVVSMARQILNGKVDGFGTYHYCGSPACTRYDFTKAIMAVYGDHTSKRPRIEPATSAEYAHLAPRPSYSVMDCAKIKRIYGIEQPSWQEHLVSNVERFLVARKVGA